MTNASLMTELLAAPRDASWYARPGRAEVSHIAVTEDGKYWFAACRKGRLMHGPSITTPLVETILVPAHQVRPVRRCQRPGCKKRWPGSVPLKDGLYQVDFQKAAVGFVVEGGRITLCPPYLRAVLRTADWTKLPKPQRVITDLILVTGSRSWRDKDAIRRAIEKILAGRDVPADQVGMLHGGAGGADEQFAEVGDELGMLVVPMNADWDVCDPNGNPPCTPGHRKLHKGGLKTFCPTAGYRRNQSMCDRTAAFLARGGTRRAVCLVARSPGKSSGTDDCAKRAKDAGLRIVLV